ncbi:speriolin-like protein isoform X2 [Anabas testudineus]|uniref:speriolin-like protein isoform X2 n=1 Tax=Anabas testudineus TaxID=64144 RepID=UPI000E4646C8|nr:speriolin-like protein isoform X2 [Anabas testudineus]
MDQDQTIAALLSENERLGQENYQLKWTLSLVKENHDLRERMSFNSDSMEELTGRKQSGLQQTIDEEHFRKHLQKNKFKHEHRTSSPVDFKSFIQSSMHTSTSDKAEAESSKADTSHEATDRVLGEIAYQLDRRILSHVFQGHRRLYGFTLLNIPEKIVEVSTHPLTGKVDEDYRLHLTQRHGDLMMQLNHLGYKATLHPVFVEFIVNTYGILKEKPDKYSNQAIDYNNPDFARKVIMTTAPEKLQKDLLVVLTCLCYMAERDRKPLILW